MRKSARQNTFKNDRFSNIFHIYTPKPANIIYDYRTDVETDCLCPTSIDDSIWLLRKLYDTGDIPAVQTSAYNSANTDIAPRTICCALQFLSVSSSGWNNPLKMVQNFTVMITLGKKAKLF